MLGVPVRIVSSSKFFVVCLSWSLTPFLFLTVKVISWWLVKRLCVSRLSHTSIHTTFLSKDTDNFPHMHQVTGEKSQERTETIQIFTHNIGF